MCGESWALNYKGTTTSEKTHIIIAILTPVRFIQLLPLVTRIAMKLTLLLAVPAAVSALAYNPFRLPDFKPSRTTTVQKRADTWGGAVSLGPTKSTIVKAVTTIVPGAAPSTQNGELFLWPGMSNGTGDLVQTTLESWAGGNSWCGAKPGQWCIRCSLFGSFGQLDGPASPVSGDMKVEILYELQADGQTWKQTATDLGTKKQLSTFSHKSGPYMVRFLFLSDLTSSQWLTWTTEGLWYWHRV